MFVVHEVNLIGFLSDGFQKWTHQHHCMSYSCKCLAEDIGECR